MQERKGYSKGRFYFTNFAPLLDSKRQGNGKKLMPFSIAMNPGEIITMKKNEKHSLKAQEKTSFILIMC